MEEKIIKEIIKLTKERDRILSQFRKYFGVTDPKFQPVSLSFGDDGSIFLVSQNNRRYKISVSGKLIIENTGKEIPIDGTSVAINWIENKIKEFNDINNKLKEL